MMCSQMPAVCGSISTYVMPCLGSACWHLEPWQALFTGIDGYSPDVALPRRDSGFHLGSALKQITLNLKLSTPC